jgi:outer membrane receptor protein involved in Fe transport
MNNIARVEVIRGPGSALYGADAFAGVINVVTKTSQGLRGSELGGRVG